MELRENDFILIIERINQKIIKKIEKIQYRRYISSSGYIQLNELIGKTLPLKVKTNKGNELLITEPTINDVVSLKYKRGPQTIHPKDIGFIIKKLGITKDMKILEAGAGSGFLTTFLGIQGGEVITFEKEDRFYNIVKHNLEILNSFLNQKNLKSDINLINKDINECNKKDFDAIFLDFLNSYDYTDLMFERLKYGGQGAFYLPNLKQAFKVIENLKKSGFQEIEMFEVNQREYDINKYRPVFNQLVHTAYLIFTRKL